MLEIINHGTVREIRMARPPANAINLEMMDQLTQAFEDAAINAQAVVLSGRPGMFTAGLDVPELIRLDRDEITQCWLKFTRLQQTIAALPIPSAIAMTGHAPAAGIVMALFGDYRVMADGDYVTGLNEVQIGLVVTPLIYQSLLRVVGARTAEKILVAGELLKAGQAFEIGLIDELADDPDDTVARAISWCEKMLNLPREAMLTTRTMARSDLVKLFENTSDANVNPFVDSWFSEETQSALKGLVERLQNK